MVVPKWKSRSCRVFVTGRYLMVRPTCASTVIINTATIERRNSAVRAIPLIFYKNYISTITAWLFFWEQLSTEATIPYTTEVKSGLQAGKGGILCISRCMGEGMISGYKIPNARDPISSTGTWQLNNSGKLLVLPIKLSVPLLCRSIYDFSFTIPNTSLVKSKRVFWPPTMSYRKISKISPGAYIFQRPFWEAYFWRGLYSDGRFNGGFFALRFWGAYIWRGLYVEGLIFRILR